MEDRHDLDDIGPGAIDDSVVSVDDLTKRVVTDLRDDAPPLRELAPGHTVACHWAERIRAGEILPREREPEPA